MPPIDVLVQVLADNSEGTKHGVTPDEAIELANLIRNECPFLKFRGLMSMGEIGNLEEFRVAQ